MYLFECEAVFEADLDAVWKVWTDVAGWPEWDVSKEIAQLDGPFPNRVPADGPSSGATSAGPSSLPLSIRGGGG